MSDYKNFDYADFLLGEGYEPVVKIVTSDLQTRMDDAVMKAVYRLGIDVDREELIRAINYDRNQYDKGFSNGYQAAMRNIVRCKDCKHYWKHNKPAFPMCLASPKDDAFCSEGERRSDEE